MNNFNFQNPTRLVFGKGQIEQLANLIPADKNIMNRRNTKPGKIKTECNR